VVIGVQLSGMAENRRSTEMMHIFEDFFDWLVVKTRERVDIVVPDAPVRRYCSEDAPASRYCSA
jgi:hypothetical protein